MSSSLSAYLPKITYLETEFVCRMTTRARFSSYKGSMLRGALGNQLRKWLCMSRKSQCPECHFAKHCLFIRLFWPGMLANNALPPPFCIEPGADFRQEYEKNEIFIFKLKLFSFGIEYLPFFVNAYRAAGETGIGSTQYNGKYILESIIWNGKNIYNTGVDTVIIPDAKSIFPEKQATENPEALVLRLVTPLRYKSGNRFSPNLDFIDLFHLILRRISTLASFSDKEWRLKDEIYDNLKSAARTIQIKKNNLYWKEWSRYSSRQHSSMKFGGLIGSIAYEGNLGHFSDLLQGAIIAHLGKQTSFGLGQIDCKYD